MTIPIPSMPLQHFPALSKVTHALTGIRQAAAARLEIGRLQETGTQKHPRPTWTLRLPAFIAGTNVRVHWTVSHVMLADDLPVTLDWHISDRGVGQHRGTCTIERTGTVTLFDGAEAAVEVIRCSSDRVLAAKLGRVASEGHAAQMHVLTDLDAWLTWQAQRVCAVIAQDLGHEPDYNAVLDDSARQSVVTTILFGNDGETDSHAIRRLNACALDDRASAGDPRQHIARNLRRDLDDCIRRRIGDPNRGSTIRRAARDLAAENGRAPSVNEVVEHLRGTRPNDKIGIERVRAALSVQLVHAPVPLHMDRLIGNAA